MRPIAISMFLACFAHLACAQAPTLRDALGKSGIPTANFTPVELSRHVNAADGRDGSKTYLVYVRLDDQNSFEGAPRFVRYDATTHRVLRKIVIGYEEGLCCGSPLDFQFTRHYLLASFHANPSANAVVVMDKQLHYKAMIYGFGFHPVGPDGVVYVEDEVHFAPAHPGRLAFANLNTGARQELYPSTNDVLRTAFAKIHEKHMPPQADCEKNNDPCKPDYYDEDISILGTALDMVRFKVDRTAAHNWLTEDGDPNAPTDSSVYVYTLRAAGWRYCGMHADAHKQECEPNLPVLPVAPDAFTPKQQGVK